MTRMLATLIGYIMLATTPAFAQAAPAPTADGEFPWLWIIVVVVALAAGIWWYMNRIRGPRV